jgi:hypothetical protein
VCVLSIVAVQRRPSICTIVAIVETNAARRPAAAASFEADRRLQAWEMKPAAPISYFEHDVSTICCVLGEHPAIDVATYFQPPDILEFSSFREPVTD